MTINKYKGSPFDSFLGLLAFTSGTEYGEVWSNNGGQELYHASLSADEYESLLKETAFKVLIHKINDPQCGDATVWVAQKLEK